MATSLLTVDGFAGFGRFQLMPGRRAREYRMRVPVEARLARRQIREEAPMQPGVYGMLDREDRLIYVGKAKSLRNRLLSYFTGADEESKSLLIGQRSRTIVWEPLQNELVALLRELELIRRFRPQMNVRSQPGRVQPMFVCIGRMPAPYVFLAATPPKDRIASFGPIRATRRARDVVQQLNVLFQLRDCPQQQKMAFADQRQLFESLPRPGCLRWELGTCMGPCAMGCTRQAYFRRVDEARRLLAGEPHSLIEEARRAMLAAAADRDYERAMALRDMVIEIEWFIDQLHRLTSVRAEYNFIYPTRSRGGGEHWHFIRNGQICRITRKPRSAAARRATIEWIERLYGAEQDSAILPTDDVEHVMLIARWFQRQSDELNRTLRPHDAIAHLQRSAD